MPGIVVGLLLVFVCGAHAHGWIREPVSKNEMAAFHYRSGMPDSLRYEPQTCYWGNNAGKRIDGAGFSCGAKEAASSLGLATWQKWYDAAKVAVPTITPGQEIAVNITITADHGGQSWLMIACDDHIGEDVQWTYLERAQGDRNHHFMPSNPSIYAWATSEAASRTGDRINARWVVPSDFSCAGGKVVGRWLWKTGSTCNDAHNIGRPTQNFSMNEFQTVVDAFHPGGWVKPLCTVPPETFISCLDFMVAGTPPAPSPPTPPLPPPPPPPPKTPTCCWSNWGGDSTCGDYTGPGSQCNTNLKKHCNTNGDCAKTAAVGAVDAVEPLVTELVTPTCCYSKWGDNDHCGQWTGPGPQCNTELSKKCTSSTDCPRSPTPTPPAPPTPPTPPAPPTPSPPSPPTPPTPPGPGAVSACHDAAKAYCSTKGGYCSACQAWGNWGDMFFVTICNDDPHTCHQPLQAAGNITCFCQKAGGCTAHGATCPGPKDKLMN